MTPIRGFFQVDHLDAELLSAIAAALASGTHRDHSLLIIHEKLRTMEQAEAIAHAGAHAGAHVGATESSALSAPIEAHRRSVLRSLVCTPAHTPLGIATKLAIACAMSGVFEEAQEAPGGPVAPHVILSAFLDAMAQARLLPSERPSPSQ